MLAWLLGRSVVGDIIAVASSGYSIMGVAAPLIVVEQGDGDRAEADLLGQFGDRAVYRRVPAPLRLRGRFPSPSRISMIAGMWSRSGSGRGSSRVTRDPPA
jgi:hypothetical protein